MQAFCAAAATCSGVVLGPGANLTSGKPELDLAAAASRRSEVLLLLASSWCWRPEADGGQSLPSNVQGAHRYFLGVKLLYNLIFIVQKLLKISSPNLFVYTRDQFEHLIFFKNVIKNYFLTLDN